MENLANSTKNLDLAIRQHRTATATIALTHAEAPIAHQAVVVEQKNHQFLFGSNWGDSTIALANGELAGKAKEQAELRNERFLQLFNQATLPFYWAGFEPIRGQPQTQRILQTAQWYKEHLCAVKGHPLCWHTLTADWLLKLSNQEILRAQVERIQRDVADFAGLIDMWDVVNEAVIMPIFDRYDNGITRICKEMGRINLLRTMFETARAVNPAAVLLINDFDVSPAYDILIEGCLEAGLPIDVIGIQSHMHQGYWGSSRTLKILERFERFHLPIHFSENTLVSGQLMPPEIVDLNDYQVHDWPSTTEGEERQAQEVVLHYKTLLSRPAVQAITWWDLSDGSWLNAPSGLLRKDHSPKPAYDALLKLVKGEWWMGPTKLMTDADGQLTLTGFLGVLAVAFVGFRLWGRDAGLMSAAVLASSLFYAFIGHINTLDMGVTFFLTGGLFALMLAQQTPREDALARRWMMLAWAMLGLAVLSKGLIGAALPFATLVLYSLVSRDFAIWRRLHLLRGITVFLIVTAPWFIAVSLANPEFFHFFFIHEHFERFLTKVHSRYRPWW